MNDRIRASLQRCRRASEIPAPSILAFALAGRSGQGQLVSRRAAEACLKACPDTNLTVGMRRAGSVESVELVWGGEECDQRPFAEAF